MTSGYTGGLQESRGERLVDVRRMTEKVYMLEVKERRGREVELCG